MLSKLFRNVGGPVTTSVLRPLLFMSATSTALINPSCLTRIERGEYVPHALLSQRRRSNIERSELDKLLTALFVSRFESERPFALCTQLAARHVTGGCHFGSRSLLSLLIVPCTAEVKCLSSTATSTAAHVLSLSLTTSRELLNRFWMTPRRTMPAVT